MLQFQPPGFGQRALPTSLGVMAYYTPTGLPWVPVDAATEAQNGGSGLPESDRSRPTLLFLHSLGGGSSAYEWSKVYPAFASQYRVIAPDLVGWGQSTHPEREYRVQDYLTVITELIEQVGQPPVTVFASSLTGGIVLQLAVQRPELFRQLILACPSGYADFGNDYQNSLTAQIIGVPGLNQLIYAVGAANELAVRNFLQQFLFARRERITDEMVAAYVASATQFNAQYAAFASLKGDLCFDLANVMPQLRVPTVLLWGDRAWFSSVETGKRLAGLNPQAVQRFHIIPNAGVLPHLEVPAVVVGLAQSHLGTV